MSTEPMSSPDRKKAGQPPSSWLVARPLWAGLSIITMWLAVLFVGVFGGSIVSSTPGSTSTSVPVVLGLIPFVLPATVVVARRGFKDGGGDQREARDATARSSGDATHESAPLTPRHA